MFAQSGLLNEIEISHLEYEFFLLVLSYFIIKYDTKETMRMQILLDLKKRWDFAVHSSFYHAHSWSFFKPLRLHQLSARAQRISWLLWITAVRRSSHCNYRTGCSSARVPWPVWSAYLTVYIPPLMSCVPECSQLVKKLFIWCDSQSTNCLLQKKSFYHFVSKC